MASKKEIILRGDNSTIADQQLAIQYAKHSTRATAPDSNCLARTKAPPTALEESSEWTRGSATAGRQQAAPIQVGGVGGTSCQCVSRLGGGQNYKDRLLSLPRGRKAHPYTCTCRFHFGTVCATSSTTSGFLVTLVVRQHICIEGMRCMAAVETIKEHHDTRSLYVCRTRVFPASEHSQEDRGKEQACAGRGRGTIVSLDW